MTFAALGMAALLAAGSGQAAGHEEAVRLLNLMKAANASIVDLKCTFRFQVTKNGKEFPRHHTVLRLRSEPETIHMAFVEPYEGRKVLYVKGQNGGKLRVRPGGLWKFLVVSLDPEGERAMKGAIDPFPAQGFPNIVRKAEEVLESVQGRGDCLVSVDWNVEGEGRTCAKLRIAAPGVGEMTLLVDQTTYFPYRIVKRNGSDGATYVYEDVQLNPGMKDSEFTVSAKH
jgi:outer membrane lipoprotein-sorting protein